MSNDKKEALSIVENLNILPKLSSYGRAELVGSVVLDLIVKRDIDIHLLLVQDNLISVAQEVVGFLLQKSDVQQVRATKYYGDSINITIDSYKGSSGDWSIDIWLTTNKDRTGFEKTEKLKKELMQKQRETIMQLKEYMHKQGRLRDGMSSVIYKAVIESEVRTPEELELFFELL